MEWAHCWRCEQEVPLLDEGEWQTVRPLLDEGLRNVKDHRVARAVPLSEVRFDEAYAGLLAALESLGVDRRVDPQTMWHHRRSSFGALCKACGMLLRTPEACSCAACGAKRSDLDPTPRTPLSTEVKWGLGVVLLSLAIAAAALFAILAHALPL